MTISAEDSAVADLRRLLNDLNVDAPFALEDLEPPYAPRKPTSGWLWHADQPATLPGLRSPDAYQLRTDDPDLGERIHLSPAAVLGAKDLDHSESKVRYSPPQQAYLRSSLDVTMKGGIASGVIYPLALCELARTFRLRNIGGASAGAIAAALAAAAELGRAKQALAPADSHASPAGPAAHDPPPPTSPNASDPATPPERTDATGQRLHQDAQGGGPTSHGSARADANQQPSSVPSPDPPVPNAGRCRQGFEGLADIIAWLTQIDDKQGSAEEFRTAQLFKPTQGAVRYFRVVAAVLRRRFWTLPVLAATSFGPAKRAVSVIFLGVLPFLVYFLASAATSVPAPVDWWQAVLVAAGSLLALSVLSFGILTGGVLLASDIARRRQQSKLRPKALQTPWLKAPESSRDHHAYLYLGLGLLGLALLVIIAAVSPVWLWLGPSRLILVWVLGVLIMITTTSISVGQLVGRAKAAHYGLISGLDDPVATKRLGNGLSRAAGLPPVSVTSNINDWIDQRLRDLAGVSDVLTFGDLWRLPSHDTDADATWRAEAILDTDKRLVNLELMTTDLVHRVPYRFPLTDPEPGLLVRRTDLEDLFSEDIVDALCTNSASETCRDVDSGEPLTDLFVLPSACDLPVIFAVRISLAFPGLFTAVRLYSVAARADGPLPRVRNEYGQMIMKGDVPVTYPAPASSGERPTWVQELWLSDGGIASNFPIHFFDAVLPRWPTVGINLGPYPAGFGHQDVYLPTDQQATRGVPAPISRSFVSFLGAVFDTARNWRDTAQTLMPATRGRIAWVRQSSSEGGANLFMTRETVASLALRGAVAGARLRRRFASQGQWRRHQWLRLRVGGDNLADLRKRLTRATYERFYADLCGGAAVAPTTFETVLQALAKEGDPTLPGNNPFPLKTPQPADPSAVAETITPATTAAQATTATAEAAAAEGITEGVYDWYEPRQATDDLWDAVQALVAPYLTDVPASALSDNVPTPAVALRQVPSP